MKHYRFLRAQSFGSVLVVLTIPLLSTASPQGQTDNDARATASQGLACARHGAWAEAERKLRLAVSERPHVPAYEADLAEILSNQGKFEEAHLHLGRALSLDSTNSNYRSELAVIAWRLGRLDEAAADLSENLKTNPDDKRSILVLGIVRASQGRCSDSVHLLASLGGQVESDSGMTLALLRSCYLCGQRNEARRVAGALGAHSRDSVWSEAIFSAGQVASAANDFETAEILFEKIQQSYAKQAALNFELGNVQLQTGRFRQAQQSYERAAKIYPDSPDIQLGLAGARTLSGNGEAALSGLGREIEQFPNDSRFLLAYADILQQLPEYSEAVFRVAVRRYLERAISIDPTSARAHYYLGQLLISESKFDNAITELEMAVKYDPDFRQAHFALSSAYRRAARSSEADKQYFEFRRLEQAQTEAFDSKANAPDASP